MANVYEPRFQLSSASSKSSSSSENDIADEVFLNPGKGAAGPTKFGLNLGKRSRTSSEPLMMGKEISREDLKGRTQALSDSSNFKRGEEAGPGKSTSSSGQNLKKGSPVSDGSDGFPEPESIRKEVAKDSRQFSILFEEDEQELGLGLTFPGSPQFMEGREEVIGDIFDNGSTFLGDLAFDMSTNVTEKTPSEAVSTIQPSAEDEDDSMYPEIERFPGCCAYDSDDFQSVISPMDVPRLVLRSFDSADNFPELPDDLFKEDESPYSYSAMDLPEAEVPELPVRTLWLAE